MLNLKKDFCCKLSQDYRELKNKATNEISIKAESIGQIEEDLEIIKEAENYCSNIKTGGGKNGGFYSILIKMDKQYTAWKSAYDAPKTNEWLNNYKPSSDDCGNHTQTT